MRCSKMNIVTFDKERSKCLDQKEDEKSSGVKMGSNRVKRSNLRQQNQEHWLLKHRDASFYQIPCKWLRQIPKAEFILDSELSKNTDFETWIVLDSFQVHFMAKCGRLKCSHATHKSKTWIQNDINQNPMWITRILNSSNQRKRASIGQNWLKYCSQIGKIGPRFTNTYRISRGNLPSGVILRKEGSCIDQTKGLLKFFDGI